MSQKTISGEKSMHKQDVIVFVVSGIILTVFVLFTNIGKNENEIYNLNVIDRNGNITNSNLKYNQQDCIEVAKMSQKQQSQTTFACAIVLPPQEVKD